MEPERFDALARTLAKTSRRAVLRLLAGGGAVTTATRLGQREVGAVCAAAGSTCTADGQCCSGKCKLNSLCGVKTCCLGATKPCIDGCQCCSGSCDTTEPRRCCQPDGFRCRRNAQCCFATDSICKGRKCCRRLGAHCVSGISDSKCCTGLCSAGGKCCQALGKACTAFGQCCSGFCSQGKCVTFLPLP